MSSAIASRVAASCWSWNEPLLAGTDSVVEDESRVTLYASCTARVEASLAVSYGTGGEHAVAIDQLISEWAA